MNRLYARYNRLRAARFVVNTLPKSGTNLLIKAVQMFPGIHAQTAANLWEEFARPYAGQSLPQPVPLGIGWPRSAPQHVMEAALDLLRPGGFGSWHVPFSTTAVELVRERQIPMLLMLRDPRDVCLSHVQHVMDRPDYPIHARYEALSPAERLLTSIRGFEPEPTEKRGLLSIDQRCRAVLDWAALPFVRTITFEKLVGERGGGTRDDQIATLRAITDHLHIRHGRGDLERIADGMFGGTHTFHKGQIGRWRDEFREEHKAAFKAVAGPLLIELGYEKDDGW